MLFGVEHVKSVQELEENEAILKGMLYKTRSRGSHPDIGTQYERTPDDEEPVQVSERANHGFGFSIKPLPFYTRQAEWIAAMPPERLR